jgi:hypothetical protein
MKRQKRKAVDSLLDKVVEVTFWDHVNGSDKPVQCRAYGKVLGETEESLCIAYWILDDVDQETQENNREVFAIVKSTIKHIEIMI